MRRPCDAGLVAMRALLLLAAACLLAVPGATANHEGDDSPLSCDDRLVTDPEGTPCMDYCLHGMGTHYRLSTQDPTNVFPGNCWAS